MSLPYLASQDAGNFLCLLGTPSSPGMSSALQCAKCAKNVYWENIYCPLSASCKLGPDKSGSPTHSLRWRIWQGPDLPRVEVPHTCILWLKPGFWTYQGVLLSAHLHRITSIWDCILQSWDATVNVVPPQLSESDHEAANFYFFGNNWLVSDESGRCSARNNSWEGVGVLSCLHTGLNPVASLRGCVIVGIPTAFKSGAK